MSPRTRTRPRRTSDTRRVRHAALAVLAAALPALVATLAPLPASSVAALPAGFTETPVASLADATGIEQLPDGRVVVLQQSGQVRLIQAGALVPAPALDLAVCANANERGLLGVTADPGFATNGHLYLYFTRVAAGTPGGCVNRLSRFTMSGASIDAASEVVLLDGISSVNGNHNGGDLAFGDDGYLYVSVGDAGRDPRGDSGSAAANDAAQDLSLLNGKILRIDPATGEGAPGNPLIGAGAVSCRTRGGLPSTPTTSCAEIYAWGLRNPWRIAMDPNDAGPGAGRFFINDVGQSTREEVNAGAAGANYGWNQREGVCPTGANPPCEGPPAGLTDPIFDYQNAGARAFITAGAFVPDDVWPAEYEGGYLFGDGGSGEMWLRRADGGVDMGAPFATGLFGLADMAFVREEAGFALYVTLAGTTTDSVRRIFTPYPAGPPTPPGPTPPGPTPPGPTPSPTTPALAYAPLEGGSTRVLDTREGAGAPLVAGVPRAVDTRQASGTTRAVLVNLAYVQPRIDGFLTAWADGAPRPPTANVNARAGEVVSNLAIVPVDPATGRMQLYSYGDAHVVVDVLGRFDVAAGAVAAGRFQPVDPVRIADTRQPASSANAYQRLPGTPHPRVSVPVRGRGGVPAGDVQAVVLVVTALSSADPRGGFLTATAGGAPWPGTANLNTNGSSDIRPNTVVVPVGPGGDVDLHLFQVADVVVDVAGWFTASSATPSTTGRFVSIAPTREVDTRIGLGFSRTTAGSTSSLDPAAVPADAVALAHNIAIVDNAAPGFVTPFPGGPVPLVAAGNVTTPGQVRSVLALTRLSATPPATMSYFTYMATDLVVDVTGWFQGEAASGQG